MPTTINSALMRIYPYVVNDFHRSQLAVHGPHIIVAANRYNRNITVPTANDARSHISAVGGSAASVPVAGGDTYYLPYDLDKIYSMRLPCPAPGGVTLFVTANMSGCKFFIDTITNDAATGAASNDLIVYHANMLERTALGHAAPPPNFPTTPANFQNPAVVTALNNLHTQAMNDYQTHHGLTLYHNDAHECAKGIYLGDIARIVHRKQQQERNITNYCAGTIIVGFPVGVSWEFWYQTWADLDYTRPSGGVAIAKSTVTLHWHHLHKLRTEKRKHIAQYSTVKVIDCQRFYP